MGITIQHQIEKTYHIFDVVDPNNLTSNEVRAICTEMNVKGILVNGKYYELKGSTSQNRIRTFSAYCF